MAEASSAQVSQRSLHGGTARGEDICVGSQAPWDFYIMSSATCLLLLSCWQGAKILDGGLTKIFPKYAALDEKSKKNVCIYFLELLFTTPAFLYCISVMPHSLDFSAVGKEDVTVEQVKAAGTMGSFVIHLYVFEIIYKDRIDWMMLSHHLMTIFIGATLWNSLYYTLNMVICAFSIVLLLANSDLQFLGQPFTAYFSTSLLFAAVTEQPTFVALIMYRISESRHVRKMLQIAAVSSCLTKLYAFCLTWTVYDRIVLHPVQTIHAVRGNFDWELFFKVYIPIASILLVVLQVTLCHLRCLLRPASNLHCTAESKLHSISPQLEAREEVSQRHDSMRNSWRCAESSRWSTKLQRFLLHPNCVGAGWKGPQVCISTRVVHACGLILAMASECLSVTVDGEGGPRRNSLSVITEAAAA
eukprot:758720-Hanusia_phi.AAC.5